MGLLNSSVPNLLNGVSQQADALRNPTNCAAQTNAYPSPVEGLMKRHPTEFMTDDFSVVTGTEALDTSSHVINRDTGEKYLVAVKPTFTEGGELEVWDLVNNQAAVVHYDQAVSGEGFSVQGEKAYGLVRVFVPDHADDVFITDANGYTHRFFWTTGSVSTGDGFSGGTYVKIPTGGGTGERAQEFTDAVNSASASELKITALRCGANYDIPFTNADLPNTHPAYDADEDDIQASSRNVLLVQDIEGVNGNTDMTLGAGVDTGDTGDMQAYNFGENGLQAGVDSGFTNTAMESDPRDYLKALDPKTAFKFLTVGDVTYVVNTEREVKMHKTLSKKHGGTGLVTVKQGAYKQQYIVKIDGSSKSYTTSSTESKTTTIAAGLASALSGGVGTEYHEDTSVTSGDFGELSGTDVTLGSQTKGLWYIDVDGGTGDPTGSDDAFKAGTHVKFTSIPSNIYYYTYTSGATRWGNSIKFYANTTYYVHSSTALGGNRYRITLKINGQGCYYDSSPAPSGTYKIKGSYVNNANFSYLDFVREGSNIVVSPVDEDRDFIFNTSDSIGNTYLQGFKERTQYLTDLPEQAPNGFSIRVDGDVENNIDDYYVIFKTRNGETYGEGMWTETLGSQVAYQYDFATMPHILIRQADGSFLFKAANGIINASPTEVPRVTTKTLAGTVYDPGDDITTSDVEVTIDGLTPHERIPRYSQIVFDAGTADVRTLIIDQEVIVDQYGKVILTLDGTIGVDYPNDEEVVIKVKSDYAKFNWQGRTVGDETTNPDPSFVGKKINNIFFYENRLGLLADENCILSETGEFFNFFRVTIIDLLDTSPIDLAVSSNEIAVLRHAVPYKGNLLLFSDNQQFALGSGRQALSNETVALTQTSYDECNPRCNPVASGSSLYFGYDRGGYSGMRQMMLLDAQGDNYASADITEHVPQYVPNSWKMMASMPQQNLIIGLSETTDGSMQDIYLYKFMDRGNERVQSAWFKYSLPLIGNLGDQKQIIGIHAIDNILYILCQWRYVGGTSITGGKTYLYKMRIENDRVDDNSIHTTNLDSRIPYDGADATGGSTVAAQGVMWCDGLSTANNGDYFTLTNTEGLTWKFIFAEESTGTATGNPNESYIDVRKQGTDLDNIEIRKGIRLATALKITESPVTSFDEIPDNAVQDDTLHYSLLTQDVAGASGNTTGAISPPTATNLIIYPFGLDGLRAGTDAVSTFISAAYDSPVSGKTTFTLPFTWGGSVIKAYTKATQSDGGGAELTIDSQDGTAGTLVIDGDKTGSFIWFGLDYTMSYEFSKPVMRGQAGRGSSILAAGRFQVLSCDLSFDDTTTFTATVTNPGRANDYTYTQLASSTDVLSTVQGSNAITSGNFRIPIHTKSDAYTLTITSSSPFPVHFMSAEYEAQYNARSRRMSI